MIYEFYGNTYRTRFVVDASSEEEARKMLADDPAKHEAGGYSIENTPESFDLNDEWDDDDGFNEGPEA